MTARVVSAAHAAAPDEAATNPAMGVADASTKPTDAASLLNPANETKLHVLLVEDDHATLVFVKALLKSCGHSGAHPRRDVDRPVAPRRRNVSVTCAPSSRVRRVRRLTNGFPSIFPSRSST